MMDINTELHSYLRELHLPTFRECYQSEADLARRESLPHEQYLLELARKECEERAHSRTDRYLRCAGQNRKGVVNARVIL